MGKLDAFMFSLILIILALFFGVPMYVYGWYKELAWWIGFIIVCVPTGYSFYLFDKIFPSPYSKKWTLNGSIVSVISIMIGFTFLVGYGFVKDVFEENELKVYGIERIGIINNYKYRKSGGYYIVNFKTLEDKEKESEIDCKISDFKKGDTVIVIYSKYTVN
jgi:hypothetical protein